MSLETIIRIKELLIVLAVSRATLWRWIRDGAFPAPLRLGTFARGWKRSDIQAWIDSRVTTRAKA
jgi:prophage regulatory protein